VRTKLVITGTAVLVVALGAAGFVWLNQGPDETVATVTAVESGDTLRVRLDGEERLLHLTDVAAPKGDECLATEATMQLAGYASVDSELRLELGDGPVPDGDLTAAAYLSDGRLLSEVMAADGLAYLVMSDDSGEYQWPVRAAQEEARFAKVGLFSTEVDCTIPGQVFSVSDRVEAVTLELQKDAGAEALAAQRGDLDALLAEATALVDLMGAEQGGAVWDVLRMSDRIGYAAQAQTAVATLELARGEVELVANGIAAEDAEPTR
jgi:endonuclease YncB( thermonuclease family)